MFSAKVFRSAMVGSALCLGAFGLQAATVDFATVLPLGNLPQTVTASGIVVSGFKVSKADNTQWMSNVILNNRNQGPTEFGLGVCSDVTNCPATNNGNINEIDNNGSTFEVIRLDFGMSTLVSSIGLSSLDTGLKDGFAIFGSNTAMPTLSGLSAIAQGTNQSAGSVTPSVTLNQSFRYFFVTSKNRGVEDSGSDFLLRNVNANTVPEPGTLGLLGAGLVGVGLFRRSKRSKQA